MAGGAAYQAAQLHNQQQAAIATAAANVQKQLTTIQTNASHVGLSQHVIDLQNALSQKYGIVTFDTGGNISTVPNVIDPSVILTTGTGGKSQNVFLQSVVAIQNSQAAAAAAIPDVQQQTNDFIDNIQTQITPLLETDFTPDQTAQIQKIDDQIRALQARQAIDRATDVGNGMSVDAQMEYQSLQQDIANLENQRTQLVTSFQYGNPIKQQITTLMQTLDSLVNQSPVTAKLKQQINDTANQIQQLIQNAKDHNVTLTTAMSNAARGLLEQATFILQSPIADTQANTGGILDAVGTFLNIAKPIQDAFTSIFNPTEDDLVNMIVKQVNAQKRAAEQLRGSLS